MALKDVMDTEERDAYMLTNEAVVRAALEADVKVVSFYPGSPQTEILDTFEKVLPHMDDLRMEIATNEKVALETVAGASMVGMRSLTSMKSVGTNVASDALYSLAYTGVKGGCLCLIADDPHCHSSQSEQDGRWFGYTSYLPMLEPSTPQEMADMVRYAFDLSEEFGTIVLIRTTTRVNHQSSIVRLGPLNRTPFEEISWKENRRPYITVGEAARQAKAVLMDKIERMKRELEGSDLNRIVLFDGSELREIEGNEEGPSIGLISAGPCYLYSIESLMKLGTPMKVMKLGVINPIPERLVGEFIKDLDRVIIVEELFPYIEGFVKGIAKDVNPDIEIIGKGSGHFSEALEYNVPIVTRAIAGVTGLDLPFDHEAHLEKAGELASILPARLPLFCAGCPHRATLWSLQRAIRDKENLFLANDIGCYSMACLEPMSWSDSLICMGASMGIGAGAQYAAKEKVVALMGDSTLFHAGLPGIANAVHNNDDITLVILDNAVTAMTGQQSHPANPKGAGGFDARKIDIEGVLKGLGVEKIVNISSYDAIANIRKVKEAIDHDGPAVIISHQECALYHFRNYRHRGGKIVPFRVDKEKCEKAYNCIRDFMCPAISIDEVDGKAQIDPEICVGCGVCARLCGYKAIGSTAVDMGGEDRPYIEVDDYMELAKGGGSQTEKEEGVQKEVSE